MVQSIFQVIVIKLNYDLWQSFFALLTSYRIVTGYSLIENGSSVVGLSYNRGQLWHKSQINAMSAVWFVLFDNFL